MINSNDLRYIDWLDDLTDEEWASLEASCPDAATESAGYSSLFCTYCKKPDDECSCVPFLQNTRLPRATDLLTIHRISIQQSLDALNRDLHNAETCSFCQSQKRD